MAILDLATELQVQIISNLSLQEQLVAAQVCKYWKELTCLQSKTLRRGRYAFDRAKPEDPIYETAGIHDLFRNSSAIEVKVNSGNISQVIWSDYWLSKRKDITNAHFLKDELFFPFTSEIDVEDERLQLLLALKENLLVMPWPGRRLYLGHPIWEENELMTAGEKSVTVIDFLSWMIRRCQDMNPPHFEDLRSYQYRFYFSFIHDGKILAMHLFHVVRLRVS